MKYYDDTTIIKKILSTKNIWVIEEAFNTMDSATLHWHYYEPQLFFLSEESCQEFLDLNAKNLSDPQNYMIFRPAKFIN